MVSNEENARVSMAEGKRPKFWKLRVTPKLRMKVASSVVLLRRLRNTYVGMMLWFAGGVMQLNNGNVHLYQKTNVSQLFA